MWVHILFIQVNPFLDEDRHARKITGDSQELFPLYEMADICQLQAILLIDIVTTNSIELMMFLLRNVFLEFTLGKYCTPTPPQIFFFSFS